MATKKKKKSSRKPAAPKRRPAKKSAKKPAKAAKNPVSVSSSAPAPAPQSSNGLAIVILVLVLAVIGWLLVRSTHKPAATAAAPAPAATPEAHVIASPVAAKPAEAKPKAVAHRESAGSSDPGMSTLNYDRNAGKAFTMRCWRSEGGMAQLDVFAPRNRMVTVLKSAAGAAGWVSLSWNGKDSDGKKVDGGLYYVRPSQKSEQSVSEVWVK